MRAGNLRTALQARSVFRLSIVAPERNDNPEVPVPNQVNVSCTGPEKTNTNRLGK
jgi:hypothetical protein